MFLPKKGRLILSLDFELFWGVRDKKTIESYGANIRGVRQVIPALLQLFTQYDIHATFATVGFLFCRTKQELLENQPAVLPLYHADRHSPYANNYLNTIGSSEQEDVYHYAASLIELIRQFPAQEIATHTFSHYYFLEGASLASFEADLEMAKKAAAWLSIDLKSIVFPRNQYAPEHIAVCKKLGLIAYRGNERSFIYQPRKNEAQSKTIRALRLIDTYLNTTGHNSFDPFVQNDPAIVNLPSSRFLRPYSDKIKFLDPWRLKRIKDDLTYAAIKGEAYHLWWHPHNFGINLNENLTFLEAILRHYQKLNKLYGFLSSNMKETAEEILHTHEK
jgi:peptidoglycan/xylan/chitin deacetylase (PgdA/CDA1 family)